MLITFINTNFSRCYGATQCENLVFLFIYLFLSLEAEYTVVNTVRKPKQT